MSKGGLAWENYEEGRSKCKMTSQEDLEEKAREKKGKKAWN